MQVDGLLADAFARLQEGIHEVVRGLSQAVRSSCADTEHDTTL